MTINLFGRQFEISKPVLVVTVISTAVIAGGIGFMITASNRDIIIEAKGMQSPNDENGKSGTSSTLRDDGKDAAKSEKSDMAGTGGSEEDHSGNGDIQQEEEDIKIYIVGCVKKPGVIMLKKGQLIDDAVRIAGGLTADADPNSINMVYELKENVMLYIQSKKEVDKSAAQQNGGSSANNTNTAVEAGKGVKVVKDSGSALINGKNSGDKASGNAENGKINLNTASEAELDTLPGIGEATAREIINYREKNGPFKDIREIMKIPRIKDSRFNAIKDYITVN